MSNLILTALKRARQLGAEEMEWRNDPVEQALYLGLIDAAIERASMPAGAPLPVTKINELAREVGITSWPMSMASRVMALIRRVEETHLAQFLLAPTPDVSITLSRDPAEMWDRFIALRAQRLGVPVKNLIGGANDLKRQFVAAQQP